MEKLDRHIKEWNLVFTDTVDRLDFCKVGFDIDKTEVNYAESISLLYLISSFNKLYLLFKKEYEELEKLNLGKSIEVLNFEKYDFNGDSYRNLILYVKEPTITEHESTILFLNEINGKMKPFVTSAEKEICDEGFYRDDIELNDEISKKYLDLFEKYCLLLNTYKYIRNRQIFGDGTNGMYTSIDNYNSNLLEGLNNLKIAFGSTFINTECFVELLINLGENFGIDYDNSKLIIDNVETPMDKETCDRLFSNIYVNKKHTKDKKRY